MPFVELIEKLALELLARCCIMLTGDPVLDRFLELRQRLQAERLGELVIDRDGAGRFDRLDGDRKRRIFPGNRRRR